MKTLLFFTIIVSAPCFGKGGGMDTLSQRKEFEINQILNKVRNAETDDIRYMHNEDLREELKSFLVHPGAMTYPFSEWNTMSTITAPDGAFRIFNWNVESDFGTHAHYCYVVKPDGKQNTVIELTEDKITISARPEQTLTAEHWYGALITTLFRLKKGIKQCIRFLVIMEMTVQLTEKFLTYFILRENHCAWVIRFSRKDRNLHACLDVCFLNILKKQLFLSI